jgi:hypothetical protein
MEEVGRFSVFGRKQIQKVHVVENRRGWSPFSLSRIGTRSLEMVAEMQEVGHFFFSDSQLESATCVREN